MPGFERLTLAFRGALPTRGALASRAALTACAALATCAALALPGAALAEQPWRWSAAARIVAFGDVHGAYDELVGLLESTGVVDASLHWSGGNTTLVSLGDLLDRGPASRKVVDLLMRLQTEAPADGGAVHVVLGNHEAMNLVGDLRYVSKAQYAEFAGDEKPSQREAAYARFVDRQDPPLDEEQARKAFADRYPPGYFARQLAFRPDGRYGKWLLSLPAVVVIGDTAFMHGGLSERFAGTPGGELNAHIDEDLDRYLALRDRLVAAGLLPQAEMQQDLSLASAARERLGSPPNAALSASLDEFLRLGQAPELGAEGPLWYRGAIYCKPILARPELEHALAGLGVARIVIGHTPTPDGRVHSLYDGRLIRLDTGMLRRYFHGHPSALIIEKNALTVHYLDGTGDAAPEPEPVRQGAYGLDSGRLLTALAEGEATNAPERPRAATPIKIRYDGADVAATFYPDTRRGAAGRELAAYRLDGLLGFDLVPPTVERAVGGVNGTVQLRYPDEISETQRIARKLPSGEWCPIAPQLQLMYAFDVLTENRGRTRDNLLYHEQLSDVLLTDNGEAFGTSERLPRLADGALTLSAAEARALAALTEPRLETALGKWLDRRQIAALLARRDALLARFGPAEKAAESR